MMIRKAAVHLEEQLDRLDVQFLEHAVKHRPGGAVARIEHYLHAAGKLKLRRDLVDIRRRRIDLFHRSGPAFKIVPLYQLQYLLDLFAVQRSRSAHRFDAVVLGRIVAASDHDSAGGLKMHHGVIEQRRGHDPDIEHVGAAREQSLQKRGMNTAAAQAAIAAQANRTSAMPDQDKSRAPAPATPHRHPATLRRQCRECHIREKYSV